jgi:hypothetical protein
MLQWHGYGKLANTLPVASLEGGGRGRGARVLFNDVNWQRNIFFSKLIDLFNYVTSFSSSIAAKMMGLPPCAPPGQTFSPVPPWLHLHVFGWLLCPFVVWWPTKAKTHFISNIFHRSVQHPKR